MAIHPVYAEAILAGDKLVEFRKRRPAPDIRRVLIYATAPVMRIVGSFDISEIVDGSPAAIWEAFGTVGCIAGPDYDSYYSGAAQAVAIAIASSTRFPGEIALKDLEPRPAIPQSFSYVQWPSEAISSSWEHEYR
jgi:predicted transcriptional regulator